MKKLISIAVASLLITASLAGCGDTSTEESTSNANNSPVSQDSEETTEADEEEETEEETEEVTEEETKKETESDEESESDDEEETAVEPIELPEFEEAAETDFIGKWEGVKIIDSEGETEDVYGIPISAMLQLVINEDGTGLIGSGIGTDEEEAEEFIWTYEENTLALKYDEEDEKPATAFIYDGNLGMFDDISEVTEIIYFASVDEFTEFDWEEFYSSFETEEEDVDLEPIEIPEADTSVEADFVGKWEGKKIVTSEGEYDNIFGIPLYTMMQVVINDDGTGFTGSGIGTEEEETEEFTWTYADNVATLITDDATVTAFIVDGDLTLSDDEATQLIYLTNVDEFTEFDWDAFYEDFYSDIEVEDSEEIATDAE